MISVPFQFNQMLGVGPINGSELISNFQPVIPFKLSENWNLISRTIVPFIELRNVTGINQTDFGISDVNLSLFLSPSKFGKIIWGAGAAISLPTASKDFLGYDKWSVGPSVAMLHQKNGWTQIILIRQVWSVAGNENRADVSQLFINPGFAHAFKSGAGLGANVEMTQDWNENKFQAYLNVSGSMISKFGKLPVSFSMGPRLPLNLQSPGDWGVRFGFTVILPSFSK